MAIMDKRKLLSNYYLMVNDITFASDAIGAAAPDGRSAATTWAAQANVVFKGQLRHLLIFALMAFDINPNSLTSPEKFTIVPERKFQNVGVPSPGGVEVIDLDPTTSTEGIVLAADVTFLEQITNSYRQPWDESVGIVAEDHAVPATKAYYYGSRLGVLAYGLQYSATPALVYTEQDFAFFDRGVMSSYGVVIDDLLGANGPAELSRAHISLGNLVLGA